MRSRPQSTSFTRAESAAAPSPSTSLTAPLLQHAASCASTPRTSVASPTSSTAALHPNRFSNWRDRAASMLRGRANLRGAQQRGNDMMVPVRLATLSFAIRPRPRPELHPCSSSSASSDGADAYAYFNSPANAVSGTAPTFFAATDIADRAASTGAQPATEHGRRMMRFLDQAGGQHVYLDAMRDALRLRQQRPDGNRYIDDALLGRWIAELSAEVSRRRADHLPLAVNLAHPEADDNHFRRLASRLMYLDTPALPEVSDDEFVDFVQRYRLDGGQDAVRQQLQDFCATLGARRR